MGEVISISTCNSKVEILRNHVSLPVRGQIEISQDLTSDK
jgi:hypothetical protein